MESICVVWAFANFQDVCEIRAALFEILTFDAVSMPFEGIQSHFHTHVLYWKLLGASEPASSNNFWPLEQGKSIGRVSGVGVFMEPVLYVVKWLWMNWLGAWPLLRCYRVFDIASLRLQVVMIYWWLPWMPYWIVGDDLITVYNSWPSPVLLFMSWLKPQAGASTLGWSIIQKKDGGGNWEITYPETLSWLGVSNIVFQP